MCKCNKKSIRILQNMDYRVLSDFCPPNPLDRTCWAIHLDLTLIIIVSAPEANKVCPRHTHSLHSSPQSTKYQGQTVCCSLGLVQWCENRIDLLLNQFLDTNSTRQWQEYWAVWQCMHMYE